MKRGAPLRRYTPLRQKTRLAAHGKSESAQHKNRIQDLLRAIVIARDGGCILRGSFDAPACGGYTKAGELILQADHLVTRANSATYADSRLVVCLCKAHHGWKSVGGNARKAQYDAIVRSILPRDRVKLWDACERDSVHPHRYYAQDWRLAIAALEQELRHLTEAA